MVRVGNTAKNLWIFCPTGFENLDKPKMTGLRYGQIEIVNKQVCNSKIEGPMDHVLPKHTFCVTRYEGELWFERVFLWLFAKFFLGYILKKKTF